MCGFTGFYNLRSNAGRAALHKTAQTMTETLSHRGPDSGDVWQDPDVPLALGHRRLAIIDLSPEGHQPMHSATERYTIVFNGEIYNFLALRDELEDSGFRFRGRSDTEVMLAAAEHWGINQMIQKINGMFAFALWDRKTRELHFVRDRLGKKPLYIGWAGNTLVFGSELKSLNAHPDFEKKINPEALHLFLKHSYVSAPLSIFQNVWTLPAGHRLTVTPDISARSNLSESMKPYWHHTRIIEEARTKPPPSSDAQALEEFEALLSQCVKDRMISDVPLGAFLSGGIDSSTVVALMQARASQPVKTYSIGFKETGFDEAGYAKKVAAHLGTDHHELYLNGEDAQKIIPQLPEIYDEPFADISAIPTFLVSRFARQDVTVALSGDGGDEMLGGYTRHIAGPQVWSKMRKLPHPMRKAIAKTVQHISVERWNKLVKHKPQFGTALHKAANIFPLRAEREIYERLISHWETPPMLTPQTPHDFFDKDEWQLRDMSFAEKMMAWDGRGYLPNDILVKVDRASMAVSLEARAPLLDPRIYEYIWRLPENLKIRKGRGKWLLRQVLKRHVPDALFERPKQGFNMPVGEWLRGPMRDWAENLLSEKSLATTGFLEVSEVRKIWQAHLDGRGNHATKLWTVLMFQAWYQRWM